MLLFLDGVLFTFLSTKLLETLLFGFINSNNKIFHFFFIDMLTYPKDNLCTFFYTKNTLLKLMKFILMTSFTANTLYSTRDVFLIICSFFVCLTSFLLSPLFYWYWFSKSLSFSIQSTL